MANLSIGDALGEGFRLAGRRPLDCLVWGLAFFVLAGLPMFAIGAWVAPDYIALFHQIMSGRGVADPQSMLPLQLKLQAVQPLFFLLSLVGRAVVYGAIFRAVLAPQDRGFFYLRASSAELWLGLVFLVQAVCAWFAAVGLALLAMLFWIPTFIAMAHHAWGGWEIPVGVLGAIAAVAVWFWLFVRFSMAAPMSFAQRQFRLFESWTLTRGHGWALFGLYLLMVVIVGCIVAVVESAIAAAGFAVLAGSGIAPGDIGSMLDEPARLWATIWPWLLLAGFVLSAVGGFFLTLFVAPWAAAYRQLANGEVAA